jgi:copper(I)-binding protein
MTRRVSLGISAGLLGCALLVAALVVGGAAAQKSSTRVKVTIREWSIVTTPKTVPAGSVTFVVRNAGTMKHEFVVMKTNLAPRRLPMEGAQAKEIGFKGEIEEFKAGLTKKITLKLKPGKYVLLCNVPSHYTRGQVVRLTVTPAV